MENRTKRNNGKARLACLIVIVEIFSTNRLCFLLAAFPRRAAFALPIEAARKGQREESDATEGHT